MNVEVRTDAREQMLDITSRIAEAVERSGVSEGAALVFCRHTTAAVTVNENADPDVVRDLLDGLRRIAPAEGGWRHVEGNSDGHLKSSLVGAHVLVPVAGGRLALGTWQGIWFCEFDGPRNRTVSVTMLESAGP